MKTRTFVHEDQLTPNGSKYYFTAIRLLISTFQEVIFPMHLSYRRFVTEVCWIF